MIKTPSKKINTNETTSSSRIVSSAISSQKVKLRRLLGLVSINSKPRLRHA